MSYLENGANQASHGNLGTMLAVAIPGGSTLRYDSQQIIGEGTLQSRVYRGTYNGHDVAVKCIPFYLAGWDEEFRQPRFFPPTPDAYNVDYTAIFAAAERATRIVGLLNRQGVEGVPQLEAFTFIPPQEEGSNKANMYIVTDYIQGEDLDTILHSQLSQQQALTVGVHVLKTLEQLHAPDPMTDRGPIIHGDLKPSNIRIPTADDGNLLLHQPVVMDFEFAQEVGHTTANFPGSLAYGSPEQLSPALSSADVEAGKYPGTTKADIYSMGIMLWEALTGETHAALLTKLGIHAQPTKEGTQQVLVSDRHQTDMHQALKNAHSRGEITDSRLIQLIMQTIDPNPANRPSAGELRQQLEAILL